jgi:hypothetical protein
MKLNHNKSGNSTLPLLAKVDLLLQWLPLIAELTLAGEYIVCGLLFYN